MKGGVVDIPWRASVGGQMVRRSSGVELFLMLEASAS